MSNLVGINKLLNLLLADLDAADSRPRPAFMEGVHWHACTDPDCKRTWTHDRSQIPEGGYTAAHTCPGCGTQCYWAYETETEALQKAGR